jgi:hypothetical protein
MSHLLDIHYDYVHPIFPFLPDRSVVDDLGKSASATTANSIGITGETRTHATEGNIALLLAICGYAGQLSPSSDTASTPSATKPSTILGGGIANKIAADLWYEQARSLVMNHLRRAGSSLESVQTLLLCALRDQGKGRERQAWLLFGERLCLLVAIISFKHLYFYLQDWQYVWARTLGCIWIPLMATRARSKPKPNTQ